MNNQTISKIAHQCGLDISDIAALWREHAQDLQERGGTPDLFNFVERFHRQMGQSVDAILEAV